MTEQIRPVQIAPGAVGTNPLAGTPVSDWLRDGAALVLLLTSLALPWGLSLSADAWDEPFQIAAGRVEVVLLTILSVLSLTIAYLARFGALGTAATVDGVLLARLLMNAPYALLVVVYLILDAVGAGPYGGPGLGAAAAFGLTGAFLAAQPREFEVTAQEPGGRISRLWFGITAAVTALVAVTILVSFVRVTVSLVESASYGLSGWTFVAAVIVLLVTAVAGIAPYAFVVRRSEVARTLAIGVGIAVLAGTLIGQWSGAGFSGGGIESSRGGGFLLVWLALGAGLFSSPGVRLAMSPVDEVARWVRIVDRGLALLAIVAGAFAVFVVMGLIGAGVDLVGLLIGELFVCVLVAAGALIARGQWTHDPAATRPLVVMVLGGIVVGGIVGVVLSVVAAERTFAAASGAMLVPVNVLIAFVGLPLVLGYALLVPAGLRARFGSLTPRRTGESYAAQVSSGAAAYPGVVRPAAASVTTGAPVAPGPASFAPAPAAAPASIAKPASAAAAPAPPPPPAPTDDAARRASDPSATPAQLYALAQAEPRLWPLIAANPATYPELLDWLRQTRDPRVLDALARRSG